MLRMFMTPRVLLGAIGSDKPLKNLAAISLGFRHRRYGGLTFTVTDAIRGSSALPVDKAVEILHKTWYQGEEKSVDNPVEKLWITTGARGLPSWQSQTAFCSHPRALPAYAFSIV